MNNIVNYLHNASTELEHEKPIYNKYVDKNKSILEIGSCVGVVSFIFSQLTNKIVYAFEPNLISFNLLINNIKANNLKNIKAFNLGVGNLKKSKIIFSHPDNIGQTILGLDKNDIKNSKGQEVTMISIDNMDFLKDIGFVKIDVEGYELEVLRSGKKFFTENNPIVVVEFHGYDIKGEWKTSESGVVEKMKSYHYKVIEKRENKLIFKK